MSESHLKKFKKKQREKKTKKKDNGIFVGVLWMGNRSVWLQVSWECGRWVPVPVEAEKLPGTVARGQEGGGGRRREAEPGGAIS